MEIQIKSKLYHFFQGEVERLGQQEAGEIVGTSQSNISRVINHPESVSISWFVKSLKKLGYNCVFTVTSSIGKG